MSPAPVLQGSNQRMLSLFFGDLHLPYFHTKSCIDSYNPCWTVWFPKWFHSLNRKEAPNFNARLGGRPGFSQEWLGVHIISMNYLILPMIGGSVLRTDHWDNKIHPPSIGSTHLLLSTYPSDDHPAHWNIMRSCIVINHHSYQHHSY